MFSYWYQLILFNEIKSKLRKYVNVRHLLWTHTQVFTHQFHVHVTLSCWLVNQLFFFTSMYLLKSLLHIYQCVLSFYFYNKSRNVVIPGLFWNVTLIPFVYNFFSEYFKLMKLLINSKVLIKTCCFLSHINIIA